MSFQRSSRRGSTRGRPRFTVLKSKEGVPHGIVPIRFIQLWLRGVGMNAKFAGKQFGSLLLSGALLYGLPFAMAAPTQTQSHRKSIKKAPLPPLPAGPTGPVQQIPLDSIAAVPPQVTYENSELTIVAPNSTLADILR